MLARRNKPNEGQPHYSLRKLSIGVASVLISTSIYVGLGSKVQAAETTNSEKTTGEVVENSSQTDAGTEANVSSIEKSQKDEQTAPGKVAESSAADHDIPEDKDLSSVDKGTENEEETAPDKPVDQVNDEKQDLAVKKDATPVKQVKDKKIKEDSDVQIVDGAHQETVVGELPDLNAGWLTPDLENETQIGPWSTLAGQHASMEWIEKPDVTKVGTVMGQVKLTYIDYNDNQKQKSMLINVKLDVRPGKAKKEGQVRNRVTIMDEGTGDIINSYSFIGNRGSTIDNPSQAIAKATYLSGYYFNKANDRYNSIADMARIITRFLDYDQNVTLTATKFPSDEPMTWSQMNYKLAESGDSYFVNFYPADTIGFNDDTKLKDPSAVIANWIWMPKDMTATWEVRPVFDPNSPGSILEPARGGVKPIIKIDRPGYESHYITLDPDDYKTMDDFYYLTPVRTGYGEVGKPISNKEVQISGDPNALSPLDLITEANKDDIVKGALHAYGQEPSDPNYTQTFKDFKNYLFNPDRWEWGLQPNFSKVGTTVGFLQYKPLPGDENVTDPTLQSFHNLAKGMRAFFLYLSPRIKVNPLRESKPIKRTVSITAPDGQTTTTVQEVRFYHSKNDFYGDWSDWQPQDGNSIWAAVDVPVIPGYTASQTSVEKVAVTPEMEDQVVNITYSPVGHSDTPDPVIPDPEPTPEPTPTPTPAPQPDPKPDVVEDPDIDNTQDDQPGDEKQSTVGHKTTNNRVVTVRASDKRNAAGSKISSQVSTLPQTGASSFANVVLAAIGAVIGFLGLAGLRKRN